jgi:hypothetical protein
MKEVMIIFAVLLATLTLISAFGGGIRQKEFFYYENGASTPQAQIPLLTEEEMRALDADLQAQQAQQANAGATQQPSVQQVQQVNAGATQQPSVQQVQSPPVAMPTMAAPQLPNVAAPQMQTLATTEGFAIEPFQGCMYAGCMV